jgi:hypothetical protein
MGVINLNGSLLMMIRGYCKEIEDQWLEVWDWEDT